MRLYIQNVCCDNVCKRGTACHVRPCINRAQLPRKNVLLRFHVPFVNVRPLCVGAVVARSRVRGVPPAIEQSKDVPVKDSGEDVHQVGGDIAREVELV